MYKLRGHHLFCLLGYKGMGYSQEYVKNMTVLHQSLRDEPETWVQLIEGPDQLCEKYPNSGEYHCQDRHIDNRDRVILEKLGLKIGQILKWKDIEDAIRKNVVPSDIEVVCKTCSWRSFGVCEEGIQNILQGKGLRKVQ
jgi:uncharacterized protein